jgi:hypothetical protein
MLKLIARPSDPLVVTRELDVFFIVCWAIYAAWGITACIFGIPSINFVNGLLYNQIWSGGIGLIATVALISAISIFFKTRTHQITKKKVERAALHALSWFVVAYPALLLLLAIFTGNVTYLATSVIGLLYLLIPIYRIRHLSKRIKYYESLTDKPVF